MRFAEFEHVETQRLILRDIRMEDLLEYYERLYGDGDVCRYLLFDPHQDISESMASIEKTLARYEAGNCYRWGIALRDTEELIGIIDLLGFDEEKNTCSFAYMIAQDFWGKGYGTEALKAVLDFAFTALEVKQVVVDHFSTNPASGAVKTTPLVSPVFTASGTSS